MPRWIALSLAGLIIAVGVAMSRRAETESDNAAARKELVARREKLFTDLVRLEQERRNGKVAGERYSARRETIVASLEHVYGSLDDEAAGSELAGRAG